MKGAEEAQLYEQHALHLQAVVRRRVRTSPANVEDACGFAWMQLVRQRPAGSTAFAWLCTTAIREAAKLDRRMSQTVDLELVEEVATDPRDQPERRLELIAAGEQIRRARLRPREARLVGLRAAGYSREEVAELTGDTYRTVDRQLWRAQRKLNHARKALGCHPDRSGESNIAPETPPMSGAAHLDDLPSNGPSGGASAVGE